MLNDININIVKFLIIHIALNFNGNHVENYEFFDKIVDF
jgi:hypothetical protein